MDILDADCNCDPIFPRAMQTLEQMNGFLAGKSALLLLPIAYLALTRITLLVDTHDE